jgi:hypothetical protein
MGRRHYQFRARDYQSRDDLRLGAELLISQVIEFLKDRFG